MTKLDTTSMSADSRSATRSMPTGAAHPPTSTTIGPESAATSRPTAAASTSASAATVMSRCARGCRHSASARPAATSGRTTGSGTRAAAVRVIAAPSRRAVVGRQVVRRVPVRRRDRPRSRPVPDRR